MPLRPKLRRRRRTKIVATIGPASSTPEVLSRLYHAGADVFRLNFSHGSHEDHLERFRMIRELEEKVGRPIGILADVQGPKLRVGRFGGGRVHLQTGKPFRLDLNPTPGNSDRVNLPHPEIIAAASIGATLLLDDGKLRLRVLRKRDDALETEVVVGGPLSDRKGVNVPDVVLPIPALTMKDRADLAFAVEQGANYIGLSFVQRPEDVAELKKVVQGRAGVLAKIEKPKALASLHGILELADALMVARGDLGVEMPLERVPGLQKQITRAARKAGKPVVVATQMLESMIQSPMPTRAEVSDVATAVFDGADAVMLSAESASGSFPVEAVETMDRIACSVEGDALYHSLIESQRGAPEKTTPDAIMAAVHEVTETIEARAIVCWTKSGITAMRAARERSAAPIIAPTPSVETARRLTLVWGTHSVTTEDIRDFDDMVRRASHIARQEGFAQAGERIVITAGVPLGTTGATNMLRVAFVTDED